MTPPEDAPRGSKFRRQYERTRGYFEAFDPDKAKVILNTLFSVYPIAFERPENQKRVRDAYRDMARPLSLFDLNMMRLSQRSGATKVAICCMPKSGSTFIQTSLSRLDQAKFEIGYLHTPYMSSDFVDGLSREHEIDELALLMLELRRINWVAHMHTKWTPYTEKVFRSYGIRPIITFRNIFDCLVSMDDMLMKRQVDGFPMIRLPKAYLQMAEADRLSFLTAYAGPWYIDYVVSWDRCRLKTLRLDYDRDVLGFGPQTALAIRDHLGLDVDLDTMMTAFDLSDQDRQKTARLNKGISGRGEAIPAAARDGLMRLADVYRDEVDFTGLL
jgi:hypothetical protein